MLHKKRRAVLYARVSTSDQKDNGYSLPQQKEVLYEYCTKNDIEVIKYLEEDCTGTTLDRPQFNKFKKIVRVEKIDLLLVHKWDRFSRKAGEALSEIQEYLAIGVEINAIEGYIDYSTPHYINPLLMFLGFGEVENAVRSQRTKSGIRGALKEGRHVNRAPIGYIHGKDPNNKNKPLIKPCPDKAILIRKIFEEYATGLCSQESLRKKYSKIGIVRSKSQFSNLLSNILYSGKLLVPEHKDEQSSVVDALHEPIISEALYLKVQKVKYGKSNVRLNSKTSSVHDKHLPLRGGILVCAKCKSNLTGSRSKSRNGSYHYYYHCNPRKGCKVRFSIGTAHSELLQILSSLEPHSATLNLFKAILVDEYKGSINGRACNKKKLQNEIIESQKKLDLLTERYAEGDIDKNSYKRLKEKYLTLINSCKLEIAKIPTVDNNFNKQVSFGLSFLSNLCNFYKSSSTEIKRRILGSIFSEKLVFDENKYRTIKFTQAVSLIFNNSKYLQSLDIKKGDSISKVSYSVAGTGFDLS